MKQEAAMPVGGEGKMQRLGRGRRKGMRRRSRKSRGQKAQGAVGQ